MDCVIWKLRICMKLETTAKQHLDEHLLHAFPLMKHSSQWSAVRDHTNRLGLWSGLMERKKSPFLELVSWTASTSPEKAAAGKSQASPLLQSLDKPGELAAGAKNAAGLLCNIHTLLMDWDNPTPFANGKQQEQRAWVTYFSSKPNEIKLSETYMYGLASTHTSKVSKTADSKRVGGLQHSSVLKEKGWGKDKRSARKPFWGGYPLLNCL